MAQATDKNFLLYDKTTQDAIVGAYAQVAKNVKENSEDYYRTDWLIRAGATPEGKKAFEEWAKEQGLVDAKATNFSGDYIVYNYYDKETGETKKG
jgi:hypothetical protein